MDEDENLAAADKARKDAEEQERMDVDAGVKLDKILSCVDALTRRMDALEEMDEPKADRSKRRKDSGRRDADEGEDEAVAEDSDEDAAEPRDDADDEDETVMEDDDSDDVPDDEARRVVADKRRKDSGRRRKDEDDDAAEEAMADAMSIRKRIADVEKMLPKQMSDKDYAAMADAQAKADTVFQAFGDSAPRPLNGEDLGAYRRRLAQKLKAHSPRAKDLNLHAIFDKKAFAVLEDMIYADAMAAATAPENIAAGTLRSITRTERGGHEITEYAGDPASWMGGMAGNNHRVTAFNTNVGNR